MPNLYISLSVDLINVIKSTILHLYIVYFPEEI